MEFYEEVSYKNQVNHRGVTTVDKLKLELQRRSRFYDDLFGENYISPDGRRCISLACGYGNFMYYLMSKGIKNTVGYDLDESQVALAKKLGLNAIVGDAIEGLQRERELLYVDAIDFIEHLEKDVVIHLLQTIRSKLVSGGKVFIQCPCADGFTGAHDLCNDFTHRWAASSTMLDALLSACGFSNINIIDVSVPRFSATISRKAIVTVRRGARTMAGVGLRVLGVRPPRIWSNSQFAVASV